MPEGLGNLIDAESVTRECAEDVFREAAHLVPDNDMSMLQYWMAVGASLLKAREALDDNVLFGAWVKDSGISAVPALKSAAVRSDAIWIAEFPECSGVVTDCANPRAIRAKWRKMFRKACSDRASVMVATGNLTYEAMDTAVAHVCDLTHCTPDQARTRIEVEIALAEQAEIDEAAAAILETTDGKFSAAALEAFEAGLKFEWAREIITTTWGVDSLPTAEPIKLKLSTEPPVALQVIRKDLAESEGEDVQTTMREICAGQEMSVVANVLVGVLRYMKDDGCDPDILDYAKSKVWP